MKPWTQKEAIDLCIKIESVAPKFGAHVALSGGCLYKTGERKDCDIIIYRIRQCRVIDFEGLFAALEQLAIHKVSGFGFCHKLEFEGRAIDILSPEEDAGEYDQPEDSSDKLTTAGLLL